LLDDVVHVVVKVATDDNRSIGVLTDDIPDDISDSLRSLFEVLLLSWLEVAVENLYTVVAQAELGPAEVRPEGLHELESGAPGSRCVPAPSVALVHGLVGPEAVKVEWRLKLRLIKADKLRSVMLEKVIDDLLFGFTVEPTNVEGDHCKLLQFGLHIREVTFDVRPLVVTLHIPSLSLTLRFDSP